MGIRAKWAGGGVDLLFCCLLSGGVPRWKKGKCGGLSAAAAKAPPSVEMTDVSRGGVTSGPGGGQSVAFGRDDGCIERG